MSKPTITTLHRQLTDLVKRMDRVEETLKEHGHKVDVLERWHQDTEFAKRLLKEFEDSHPEVTKQESINTKAFLSVLAALAALTTIVVAKIQ